MRTPDGGIAPDLELAFLDMSGTVFHDNGIMERAFERTVTGLGVDPGSERFRQMLHHVRDTLGQSKAGVLEQLFASDPHRARQAVRDFERHLDELLATEGVIPVEGAEQAVTALRGFPADQLQRMQTQARNLGPAQTSRARTPNGRRARRTRRRC